MYANMQETTAILSTEILVWLHSNVEKIQWKYCEPAINWDFMTVQGFWDDFMTLPHFRVQCRLPQCCFACLLSYRRVIRR